MAARLPDELWSHILEVGVNTGNLDYRDICCLSIASRLLHRVAAASLLWNVLLQRDFPNASQTRATVILSDPKAVYRSRYMEVPKMFLKPTPILGVIGLGGITCVVIVPYTEYKNLQRQLDAEKLKLSKVLSDLKSLELARASSLALRIWQPQVVRSTHQQIMEQQPIDSEFQQRSLHMEAKICKEEIKRISTGMLRNRKTMEKAKADLESLSYNPMKAVYDEQLVTRPVKKLKLEKQKFGW